MKYIDADKLIAEIEKRQEYLGDHNFHSMASEYDWLLTMVQSLQQEQPDNMIQWTGNNLKEVIDFTGKSPRVEEWFKSWEEYESYVHSHGDILKLFSEDGSHYEVPVGAWIVKTPDGHNVPSVAKYVQQGAPGLPGYNKALLEVKSKVDELYEEASIGLNEYDSGLYNGIAETCMKLRGFIKARLYSDEQPEVDLEKELDKYLRGEFKQTAGGNFNNYIQVARHFAEWGAIHLNARKEE